MVQVQVQRSKKQQVAFLLVFGLFFFIMGPFTRIIEGASIVAIGLNVGLAGTAMAMVAVLLYKWDKRTPKQLTAKIMMLAIMFPGLLYFVSLFR